MSYGAGVITRIWLLCLIANLDTLSGLIIAGRIELFLAVFFVMEYLTNSRTSATTPLPFSDLTFHLSI